MKKLREVSIYIHIPFCTSKCYYCDFLSYSNKESKVREYMVALKEEILTYRGKLEDYIIGTIFIGGGTPSSVDSKYIREIMNVIFENYTVSEDAEISIESNPGTLSNRKVQDYVRAGINRVSMGAQSFDNEILKSIGRRHSAQDIYDSVKVLRSNGIENINIDLMSGLPNQSLEDVVESLSRVIDLKVPHISSYSLILEDGTKLSKQYLNGEVSLVGDDLDRKMYHESKKILEASGYLHYEISNYAKKGYECKHNLVYWDIKPYIGWGLGSHSYFENKRFNNTYDFQKYLEDAKKSVVENIIVIDSKEEIVDYCLMGIRKIKGIDKKDFKNRFNLEIEFYYEEIIKKHKKNGLLEERDDMLFLTDKGLDLANLVEIDFLI